MGRWRTRQGSKWTALPVAVVDLLPLLRGRAGNVLLLALAQTRPDSGGWWVYHSSREVAEAIGSSGTSVREAFSLLTAQGIFVEHEPPANASGSGRVRLTEALWVYEETDS